MKKKRSAIETAALRFIRRFYNDDVAWVDNTIAYRGRLDKEAHRILCAAKVNHSCEKGQHYPKP